MKLFKQIAKLAKEKFPNADSSTHLRKVIEETKEALKCPIDGYEYADIYIALIAAANKAGIKPHQFKKFVKNKIKINKKREWVWNEENKQYNHKKQQFGSFVELSI